MNRNRGTRRREEAAGGGGERRWRKEPRKAQHEAAGQFPAKLNFASHWLMWDL